MLAKILIVLAVLIAVFLIIAALQPADYRIERSQRISASVDTVFSQVNDLHRYQRWNPWAKFDPTAKYSHAGAPSGVGASLTWAGNAQMGEGTMTIIESAPNDRIRMKLDFRKPFASVATADFVFMREGDQTVVTWTMFGPKNFLSKAVGLFINMDKMLGAQFEEGLTTLKSIAEESTAKPPGSL